MNKDLEKYLWDHFGVYDHQKPFAHDIINEMVSLGMINNAKQAYRTLEKWSKKGIYDYGCRLDLGWKVLDKNKDKSC